MKKAAIVLFVALFTTVSCSQAMEPLPSDVNVIVDLKEYSVTLSVATIKAGTVKFGIRNNGTMVHDFELIKTDLAPDKLPMDQGAAKAKEDGLIKQMINIAANRSTTLGASLTPGHYVIICNVAGHYQLGMRAELKVE
ncbi:MAG: hypothetical protein M3R54_07970 [Chloroflexota bacterium]|nr:hypothetical protein [Chloroflexota bacterium]